MLADDLLVNEIGCLSQLSNIHHENNSSVIGVFAADPEKISNYGVIDGVLDGNSYCLLYTSPSPRDRTRSRMPSSA